MAAAAAARCPVCHSATTMKSLLQKPEKGGMPAVESSAMTEVTPVKGMRVPMPPSWSMSRVPVCCSTAGVPPLSGFWSKLFIIVAVWQSGHPVFAFVGVLASVLTLAYFLSMQRRVFFGKLAESCAGLKEANGWALAPALLLAAITVGLGLSLPWLFQTFLLPLESIL